MTLAILKIKAKVIDAAVNITNILDWTHFEMSILIQKCYLFLYPEILTFYFLTFLTWLRVGDTFSVSLFMAPASNHHSSDLSVALELYRFPAGQAICGSHVTSWTQPLCSLTQELPIRLWPRLFINKVPNQSRERPFTLWILKIMLS